jgi:hypothetical protein
MHAGNKSRDAFGHGFGGSAKHGTVCLLHMLIGMCAVRKVYMQSCAVYVVSAVCMVGFALLSICCAAGPLNAHVSNTALPLSCDVWPVRAIVFSLSCELHARCASFIEAAMSVNTHCAFVLGTCTQVPCDASA